MAQAPFTLSLQIHHVSRDLHFLTEALQTQPAFCRTAGELWDNTVRKTSVWHAPLLSGTTQQHFDRALEALIDFVQEHAVLLREFAGDDAMIEIVFSFSVVSAEAKSGELAHSMNLQPLLLYELASRQIGVKVQTVYDRQP